MTDEQRIEAADEAYRKAVAGKPYRPSNGSEGLDFREVFCFRCIHDDVDAAKYCPILSASLANNIGDDGYPPEWIHTSEGEPTCTAFTERGGPNDPDAPPPFINLTVPMFE